MGKDKKLNNLIEYKDFNLDKLENKPGKKVVENLNHFNSFDENIFHDTKLGNKIRKSVGVLTYDERLEKAKEQILKHPHRGQHYKDLEKEDPNKAKELLKFYVLFPLDSGIGTIETPIWDENKQKFVPRGRRYHELLADVGGPKSGY